MEIEQEDNGKKGAFLINLENERVGEMTYVWAGTDRIIIDHTEVSPVLKGKGAGKKMVEAAVAFAREKQIKIVPLCPFAKSVFDKTPELRDVL
jgi:predicted GNAT family acetyltransferase